MRIDKNKALIEKRLKEQPFLCYITVICLIHKEKTDGNGNGSYPPKMFISVVWAYMFLLYL